MQSHFHLDVCHGCNNILKTVTSKSICSQTQNDFYIIFPCFSSLFDQIYFFKTSNRARIVESIILQFQSFSPLNTYVSSLFFFKTVIECYFLRLKSNTPAFIVKNAVNHYHLDNIMFSNRYTFKRKAFIS